MKNYSFVIPHKNTPDLLNRCLDSIPQRSDIEIIVVDDASDKGLIPHVNRDDVKVYYLKESKGAGRARNFGLRESTGKWVLFADCDDYYENGFLIELDNFIDSNYDIIYFDYKSNLHSAEKETKFQKQLKAMLQNEAKEKANFKHLINAPWNKMYRMEFVKSNQIRFEEIPIQNDAYFVHLAASLTDNISYINKQLYFYEIKENGISRKKRKKEDIELSITTAIKCDKLKAASGAWKCISIYWHKIDTYKKEYGILFVLKLYLRRIRSGLLWYALKIYLS